MAQPYVEIFTRPGCGDCAQAKEFLSQKGIAFTEYDVSVDEAALERLVIELESRLLATLVIDGEVFRGFAANRERIEELLAK